jgi:hypothetical protein
MTGIDWKTSLATRDLLYMFGSGDYFKNKFE